MKIITSILDVKSYVCSAALKYLHLCLYHLAHRVGLLSPMYHYELFRYYWTSEQNALYRLTGSKRHIEFIPRSSFLVLTKNQLAEDLNNPAGWQQVAKESEQLIQKKFKPPYRVDPLPETDDVSVEKKLRKGICAGISSLFIYEYLKLRIGGTPFQDAAIKAAEIFNRGAPLLAAVIHSVSETEAIDWERYSKARFEDESVRQFYHGLGRQVLLFDLLKMRPACRRPKQLDLVGATDLKSARKGTYFITVGSKLVPHQTEKREEPILPRSHALAHLVDGKRHLIFDPNIGLFEHSDPDRYFESLNSYFPGDGKDFFIRFRIVGLSSPV